jgi:hypothetical protein
MTTTTAAGTTDATAEATERTPCLLILGHFAPGDSILATLAAQLRTRQRPTTTMYLSEAQFNALMDIGSSAETTQGIAVHIARFAFAARVKVVSHTCDEAKNMAQALEQAINATPDVRQAIQLVPSVVSSTGQLTTCGETLTTMPTYVAPKVDEDESEANPAA